MFDPLLSRGEHGLASADDVVAQVTAEPDYKPLLRAAFGTTRPGREQLASALASYIRSLAVGDSPFDRYAYGGDSRAMSQSAIRGLALFQGRAQCAGCHVIASDSASFEDSQYHSVGLGLDRLSAPLSAVARRVAATPRAQLGSLIGEDRDAAALGRFAVTTAPADIGRFRTPSLRNVAETAPYMHDGSVPTLEAAVDQELYYRGQALGYPLVLTPAERQDLVSFLRALTSSRLREIAGNR